MLILAREMGGFTIGVVSLIQQHFLYFFPEPQRHGEFRFSFTEHTLLFDLDTEESDLDSAVL